YRAVASTAAEADSNVFKMTGGTSAGSAAKVLPPLKPNQPSQRMNTPNAPSGKLWPGIELTIFPLYLPMRGPSFQAAMKAAVAPVKWTTVEPAKSIKPICDSQPPPHTQCPTTG